MAKYLSLSHKQARDVLDYDRDMNQARYLLNRKAVRLNDESYRQPTKMEQRVGMKINVDFIEFTKAVDNAISSNDPRTLNGVVDSYVALVQKLREYKAQSTFEQRDISEIEHRFDAMVPPLNQLITHAVTLGWGARSADDIRHMLELISDRIYIPMKDDPDIVGRDAMPNLVRRAQFKFTDREKPATDAQINATFNRIRPAMAADILAAVATLQPATAADLNNALSRLQRDTAANLMRIYEHMQANAPQPATAADIQALLLAVVPGAVPASAPDVVPIVPADDLPGVAPDVIPVIPAEIAAEVTPGFLARVANYLFPAGGRFDWNEADPVPSPEYGTPASSPAGSPVSSPAGSPAVSANNSPQPSPPGSPFVSANNSPQPSPPGSPRLHRAAAPSLQPPEFPDEPINQIIDTPPREASPSREASPILRASSVEDEDEVTADLINRLNEFEDQRRNDTLLPVETLTRQQAKRQAMVEAKIAAAQLADSRKEFLLNLATTTYGLKLSAKERNQLMEKTPLVVGNWLKNTLLLPINKGKSTNFRDPATWKPTTNATIDSITNTSGRRGDDDSRDFVTTHLEKLTGFKVGSGMETGGFDFMGMLGSMAKQTISSKIKDMYGGYSAAEGEKGMLQGQSEGFIRGLSSNKSYNAADGLTRVERRHKELDWKGFKQMLKDRKKNMKRGDEPSYDDRTRFLFEHEVDESPEGELTNAATPAKVKSLIMKDLKK